MSNQKIPNWVWLSCIPVFGGLGITYAAIKHHKPKWVWVGLGFVAANLVFGTIGGIAILFWLLQIGTAFYLRQQLCLPSARRQNIHLYSHNSSKIDINTCSKDQLVYDLGLPIVYANNIESARQEGYMFTHIEELHDVAGIPESYCSRLENEVTFGYYANKETDVSWRRLNVYSVNNLVEYGIERAIAERIVQEREKNGTYQSAIDVKNRTGIPLSSYRNII